MKTRVRAHYSTKCFLHNNQEQPGRTYELSFASAEDARNAQIPEGIAKVLIFLEAGIYIYTPRFSGFGWEFHEKSPNRASL